jgi:S-adenosylmethionine:tRNA ribosyltransferase-isomerase
MTAADNTTFPDFDYELPDELIAAAPAAARRESRLLVAGRETGYLQDSVFADLADFLHAGDLLVVNDSRVLPARLPMQRVLEDDPDGGGYVEILLVRPRADGSWLVMARPARRLRPGGRLRLGDGLVEIVEKQDDGYLVLRGLDTDLSILADRHGEMPLPPYIVKRRQEIPAADYHDLDAERYQTVYARESGSVAAPTAGLHFDEDLLADLAGRGIGLARVSLHVGPGTFRPPTHEDYACRRLHPEAFHCPARATAAIRRTRVAGGRVIAVGTTALRVLETVHRLQLDQVDMDEKRYDAAVGSPDPEFVGRAERRDGAWDVQGMTRLFIAPPDVIASVDAMITNFHLPQSSLLMLISSFLGDDHWRDLYRRAVTSAYRFYSYGDAMLILPASGD